MPPPRSELPLTSDGYSSATARTPISVVFFLLPKPKLLARFASVLAAFIGGLVVSPDPLVLGDDVLAAKGDVRGIWYDVVRRLEFRIFDMPSEIDPSGDGVTGELNGFDSPDEGEEDIMGCSDRAIVGAAFAALGELATALPRAGRRPTENLDVEDSREARDPGRSGDGTPGRCGTGNDPKGCGTEDGNGTGEAVGEASLVSDCESTSA